MKEQKILSEYDSKNILREAGVLVCKEILAKDLTEVRKAIAEIGYPVVLKPSLPGLAHKSEHKVVFLDVKSDQEAENAYNIIKDKFPEAKILVQEMVNNQREVVVGFIRDRIMGPCVMFGLGGIFTEILRDITFRLAPVNFKEAMMMLQDIKGKKILESVRSLVEVDKNALADIIVKVSNIGANNNHIKEIDINPICFNEQGTPIVVDCSVILNN